MSNYHEKTINYNANTCSYIRQTYTVMYIYKIMRIDEIYTTS